MARPTAERRHPVRLRATVTHYDGRPGQRGRMFIHDGRVGLNVDAPAAFFQDVLLDVGDLAEVEGYTWPGGFAPVIRATRIARVGRGALPKARSFSFEEMATGRHDCEWVEVTGIVRATRDDISGLEGVLRAELAVPGGRVMAYYWDYESADRARLVDAEVRMRGVLGAQFNERGQLMGLNLICAHAREIEVLRPATDPFALPRTPVARVLQFGTLRTGHRIRVGGVVTYAQQGDLFYVQDETSGMAVEVAAGELPRLGDTVAAVGFPVVTETKPMLASATIRRLGTGEPPQPRPLTPGREVDPERDANLVTVDASLLGAVTTPREQLLVLRSGDAVFDAQLGGPGAAELRAPRSGSRVRLVGVYVFRAARSGQGATFRLLLRSPGDLAVLATASWWTWLHSLILVGVVALVLAVAGVWVRTVQRQHDAIGRAHHETEAILGQARNAAAAVSQASTAILAASNRIAQGAQLGSDQIRSASSSVEELASSMARVTRDAEASSAAAGQIIEDLRVSDAAVNATLEGMARIDAAVSAAAARMRVLGQRSQEIFEIIDLIDEIASRSKLLSLNAAIEAAHAGDAGRGFGVVATEIGRLASRSKEATQAVTTLVQAVAAETLATLQAMERGMGEVRQGVALSEQARQRLVEISAMVEHAARLASAIAGAAREQTKVTQRVAHTAQTVAGVTQQSASGAAETAASVSQLVALAEQLRRTVARAGESSLGTERGSASDPGK